jgi:hypothetical protein
VDSENTDKTTHPMIFVGRFRPHAWDAVERQLADLAAVAGGRPDKVRAKFAEIVPEFRPHPHATPVPHVAAGALRAVND